MTNRDAFVRSLERIALDEVQRCLYSDVLAHARQIGIDREEIDSALEAEGLSWGGNNMTLVSFERFFRALRNEDVSNDDLLEEALRGVAREYGVEWREAFIDLEN